MRSLIAVLFISVLSNYCFAQLTKTELTPTKKKAENYDSSYVKLPVVVSDEQLRGLVGQKFMMLKKPITLYKRKGNTKERVGFSERSNYVMKELLFTEITEIDGYESVILELGEDQLVIDKQTGNLRDLVVVGGLEKVKGSFRSGRVIQETGILSDLNGEIIEIGPDFEVDSIDFTVVGEDLVLAMFHSGQKRLLHYDGTVEDDNDILVLHDKGYLTIKLITQKAFIQYAKSKFWSDIRKGKVTQGMSEHLVRVSWGIPQSISNYGEHKILKYSNYWVWIKADKVDKLSKS
jgi:hypothetical protein